VVFLVGAWQKTSGTDRMNGTVGGAYPP